MKAFNIGEKLNGISGKKLDGINGEEFSFLRHDRNFDMCMKLSLLLLFTNLVLFISTLLGYYELGINNKGIYNLIYIHIIYMVSILFYYLLIILYKKGLYTSYKFKIFTYYFFVTFIIVWCIIVALNANHINQQISPFIIVIMALSSFLILQPVESLILISSSFLVLVTGVIFTYDNVVTIVGILINVCISSILAMYIARLNYRLVRDEFQSRKIILEKNAELEENNKNKSIFLANTSHELKTPLNLIYSAEQMLKISIDKETTDKTLLDKYNKYLAIIKQNSNRLIRLINNIVDTTKIDVGEYILKPGNYDIIAVIRQIVNSVSSYTEQKGINISFKTTINEKIISFDPDSLERILLNLISNAVKYTDAGGEIVVKIYKEEGYIVFSVKDTGAGIPEEVQENIFDRYVQVDDPISRRSGGSGIGLSLVRYLVEMHHGSISLKSAPGKGSEFFIKLPDRLIAEEKIINSKLPGENDQIIEKIKLEFSDIYADMGN